ncbi:YuiA family protein [Alkalihalobacterium bogoriense]|nr:YuiA family protein [Alkalihalobacterium bogoriense]
MIYRRLEIRKGQCPYCFGVGYYHLVVGGTETCLSCLGSGKSNVK